MFRTFRRAGWFDVAHGGANLLADVTIPGALVELPAHLYPPENSTNLSLTADLALAGAVGAIVNLLACVVPAGQRAVIRSFGIFADAPVATTRVTWTVRVDGVPVSGLQAVTFIPRAAGSFSRTFDVLVLARPGQLVEVIATNVDGAPIRVGATLDGWTHTLKQNAGSN
jgi:hypothetical protein